MIVLAPVLSTIVLAMTPVARQVVQSGPTGQIAVSRDGHVAIVDKNDGLYLYDLPSRTLLRTISSATLNEGAPLVWPVVPTWDDSTTEVLLPRGGDILAIGVDGKIRSRPHWTGRIWPIGGAGKARWISRSYGDAAVLDASYAPLGTLADSESIVAAGDGKSALVAVTTGLVRFALDPVAKQQTIAMPSPPAHGMAGARLAVTSDGATAVVCLQTARTNQAVIVRGLPAKPVVAPIQWSGDMIGCEVAIAEPHGIVVIAAAGEIRGFDLATGAPRWEAPRDYGLSAPDSGIAIHGRTLLVSWRGIVMIDVVRGDVIGQIGTEVARPEHVWFLGGNQLLTMKARETRTFGPTGVDLATWSLGTGTRTRVGSAMWGSRSDVTENGVLTTLRPPGSDPESPCWTFARGTAADGAPAGKATNGSWPPSPKRGKATCLPAMTTVVGASLSTGRLAIFEQRTHQVIPMGGSAVTLDTSTLPAVATAMTFSPDGNWVLGGAMQGNSASLYVWDTRTGKRRWFTGSVSDPEISPVGDRLRFGYTAFAVSADSRQLVVAGGNTATVYVLATKRVVRSFTIASQGHVTALAFAPGAVVAGTSDGGLVVSRANRLRTATSDGGRIQQIVVRKDGRRAATVSDDGAVRLWDLAKPALLATLVSSSDGEAFAATPGGAYAGGREAADHLGWVFDAPAEGFRFERFAASHARPDVVAKRLADATTDLAIAIVRPPRVTITSRSPPTGTTVSIGVRVEASSGKVAAVRAFVNGRAATAADVNAATKDLSLAVPLEPGQNVITLVAFDDGGRSSNPRSVDVVAPFAATRPDIWVIAAGVGWYPNLSVEDQLEGSVNDAYAIADVFAAQAGPNERYANAHVTILEDEQVTPDALDNALARLAQMKPTDVGVVFLAGHGVRLPKTNDMVLLTHAASSNQATWASTGIGWSKIGAALTKAKGRVIVLLDACHAGNVTQDVIVPNTQLADDLVGSQRAGVLVFAASKGSQKSLEENAARGLVLDASQQVLVKHKRNPKQRPPTPTTPTARRERRGNGYFTGAVVAALDSPATDVNRDGVVQTAELVTQVQLRVIRASRGAQTPWVARRELFGDFALATATK